MRGVHRLRNHSWLLPAVLAALVLRALIPAGFMPATGFGLVATMCSLSDRSETIEIPGAEIPGPDSHCESCLVPMMGAAPAFGLATPPAITTDMPQPASQAPIARHALARAQIPRAPPA